MSIRTVEDPKNESLLEIDCRTRGEQPLYTGDFVSLRFQYLIYNADTEEDDAVDLTSASIVMTIYDCDGAEVITRELGEALDDFPSLDQIEIDDQGSGDAESSTGIGWFEIFFNASELTAMSGTYKIVVTLNDRPRTLLRGQIEILA